MREQYIKYIVNNIMRGIYEHDYRKTSTLLRKFMISYERQTCTEEQILSEFVNYLGTLKTVDTKNSVSHKIDYITDSIDITPSNILDIGAGTGEILSGIKNYYRLPKEKVYALDLQPIKRDDVTVIGYDENMKIPFDDGTVDLVVMLSLLHHIPPDDRIHLLTEVRRVLSPNGRVIIREHDSDKSRLFYIFIQLMHYVWYVRNNESRDPLIMMRRDETLQLFKNIGFESCNYIKPVGNNYQRLYGEVYKKLKD